MKMSNEKPAPATAPAPAEPEPESPTMGMRSHRALLTLAAFLALPLGIVYLLSHCAHFAPSPYASPTYRHAHPTLQAKQSVLDSIGKLLAESSTAQPNPQLQMRFCAGEGLRGCTGYAYAGGCTTINEQRVLSMAEPSMFEAGFSACTVYRKGVQDCAMGDAESFKHVKEFVVNWDGPEEDEDYARNGVVPLLEREWISGIGSFKCR